MSDERITPSDGNGTGLPAEALERFEAHMPLLERVVSQVLAPGGASIRDLVYLGAAVLLRCALEWDESSELSFREYAEVTVTSELLHHVHYPVPLLRLPKELKPYQARLGAMVQALGSHQPTTPSMALANFQALALRQNPYALAHAQYGEQVAYGQPEPKGPNPARVVWDLFRKRLPLILGLVILTEVGVVYHTATSPQTYVAGSTLNSGIGSKDPLGGGGDWFTQGTIVANITELMKSRTVLENTINVLGLETSPEKLAKRITVSRMGQAGLLKVEAEAEQPEKASELVNTVVREFLRFYSASQSHEARSNKAFFESQVKLAEDRLRGAENKLKSFKGREVPEMQADLPGRVSGLIAQRDEVARELSAAQAGLAATERELRRIKADPLLTQRVVNNTAVLTSSDKLRELQLNLMDAREIYGADSPMVSQLKNQIARAKSQLKVAATEASEQNPALADATARSVQLRAEIAMNGARLASLNRSIAQLQPQARSASTNQVTYEQLQREVRVAETQYMDLQTRYGQSNLVAQGANNLAITVVDAAIPPKEPLSSKLALKLILGLILSLGLGLFISFLMSLRERRREDDPEITPSSELGLEKLSA